MKCSVTHRFSVKATASAMNAIAVKAKREKATMYSVLSEMGDIIEKSCNYW